MALSRKRANVCDMVAYFRQTEGTCGTTAWNKASRFWLRLGWHWVSQGHDRMFTDHAITVGVVNDSLSMVLGGDNGGEN